MPVKAQHKLEVLLSYTLLAGVLLSSALVLLGAILFLVSHGQDPSSFHVFKGEPQSLRDLPDIFAGAAAFRPKAIIQLGLLCLIATPFLRVFLSTLVFAALRDYKFCFISLIVLVLLSFGICFEH